MNNSTPLADTRERQRALDPSQSFIVQAPAGSGKTELLVQRYLVLLTKVRFPEAIIAITFTRKAAAEMRMRILNALEMAAQQTSCASPKDQTRWELAKKVLAHDKAMHWHLLANPNRLRIQTIDSFCQTLTRQMPLLSALGEHATPLENPEFLYQLAAKELISSLETHSPWQKALLHVLKHLDNDFNRLEILLSELLGNREQWLDYLTGDQNNLRKYLEQSLKNINQEIIEQLNRRMPTQLLQELTELLNFSHYQREEKLIQKSGNLTFWQAASFLLLTQNNTWRKQVTKNEGFPSASDKKNKEKKTYYIAMKQSLVDLISHLKNQSGLHNALIDLKNAPPLYYTESQWATLAALFELLPVLVAHLQLIFQQHKKVDYTEILLCALAALGHAESPSDLALSLDYQIEHLLVDEFQDTSIAQLQLIEKLTAGWQIDEGRSLFLVGDPMQSIYRFRKAEVGLFLQIRQWGIGNIPLQALTLSVNFRSHPSIIDWINACFRQLLPEEENINRGAISFSPATAFNQPHTHVQGEERVNTYWFNEDHPLAEANKIVEIVQNLKQENPQASIAILVRARTHLLRLLPALQSAAIPYHAIEIESLAEKSAIRDLLTLTRALLHLGDRIAWLGLLRSPFCGFDLRDLTEITQFTDPLYPSSCIWQQLMCFDLINLRKETKQRCRRIVPILAQCLQEQARLPLTTWIKKTWMALGGPITLENPEQMMHVHAFLNHLEKKRLTEGEAWDPVTLEIELSKVVSQNNNPPAGHIEIMTIHKAKGLEFDHVILASLHRKGNNDRASLLLYQERLLAKKTKDFLLAPIKASHETEDPIYHYLSREEKQKTHYELARLLYVASTRAKKSLSLLGVLGSSKEGMKARHSNSFLHHLWSAMDPRSQEISFSLSYHENDKCLPPSSLVKRLVSNWKNPIFSIPSWRHEHVSPGVQQHQKKDEACKPFSYQWESHSAMAIGTVIHRLFYHISQEGLACWDNINIEQEDKRFIPLLKQAGIVSAELDDAVDKLKKALKNTLNDTRGRWILSQEHQSCYSEFALTVSQNGNLQNLIIDRSFIDSAGTRWIIDYKTTAFQADDSTTFLNVAMQAHKKQLEAYAAAFARDPTLQTNKPMRLGLYFPLNTHWHEWEYLLETECTADVVASAQGEK
ncbi:MAG: UvrD-helicase domain-containing protein [Pseudomonadota bacterium]